MDYCWPRNAGNYRQKAIQKLDFIKCSKMMELVKVCAKQVNDDQK